MVIVFCFVDELFVTTMRALMSFLLRMATGVYSKAVELRVKSVTSLYLIFLMILVSVMA